MIYELGTTKDKIRYKIGIYYYRDAGSGTAQVVREVKSSVEK